MWVQLDLANARPLTRPVRRLSMNVAIEAVIFDMDGVIMDSHAIAQELLCHTAQRFGAPISIEEVKSFGALSSHQFWSAVKAKYGLPEAVEFYVAEYDDREEVKMYRDQGPIEGITDLIVDLHSHRIRLGLATSASRYRMMAVVNMFQLQTYFDAFICGEDVSNCKPDPEVFLTTAARLGAVPECCVVVEDSRNGLIAAKAAGMKCIAFTGSPNVEENLEGAELIIDNFSSISVDDVLNV